ncbi:MAG: carboxypeptidase-like regulatory domain-containing protein [Chloroflexota bacterium]|nr:carboxypeptidase-like regulatory domain-containing protein [Chloroflexota bacterium]
MTVWNKRYKWMYRKRLLKRATGICAVALLFATYFTLVCSSVPVYAASGTGRIYGQLLHGSHKNAPVAGERVTLQMAQGNNAMDLSSAITDAHGSYSFANLATAKATSYAVYINYQGAQYTSAIISLVTKAVQQVNLTVYEATTSTANIAIVRATILLHTPDAQKGIISVSELFIFRNLDNRAYVGSLNASQGKPNALRFSLPHTASKVVLGKGFDGYNAIQVNNGFASDAAVLPGDSQFAFTFDMPYSASEYDFDYTAVYPTVLMTFLAPPEIHASSDTLSSQGPITSDQHTYTLFEGKALLADKVVHVQLAGLPTSQVVSDAPATTTSTGGVPWLVVALLIMVGILSVTGVIYRSVRRQAASMSNKNKSYGKQKTKQQVQGQVQRQHKVAPVKSPNKAGESEQALLQELLELDKTYEAATMKKAVYQERRAKIKAQLRALMSEKVTP